MPIPCYIPLMSHVEYAPRRPRLEEKMGQTDGQTPDRYITLSAWPGQRKNSISTWPQVDTRLFWNTPMLICRVHALQMHHQHCEWRQSISCFTQNSNRGRFSGSWIVIELNAAASAVWHSVHLNTGLGYLFRGRLLGVCVSTDSRPLLIILFVQY